MSNEFETFIKDTNEEIKMEAILERAFSDKVTYETIKQKVDFQINSINFGIKKINSKFNEKSKNYNLVKEQMTEIINKYEFSLKQMGEFYDEKIEQLILRKFELQTNLIGNLVRNKYLENRKNIKNNVKKNDKIKNILTLGIKKTLEKIKEKKQKSNIDVKEINKLKDKEAIEKEHDLKVKNSIEAIEEEIKNNKLEIDKINKEIYLITIEIKKINERKKEALLNAMESQDKWMTTKITKPKTFERISRFFLSKINTAKTIRKSLLDPLDEKIDSFIETVLDNMK